MSPLKEVSLQTTMVTGQGIERLKMAVLGIRGVGAAARHLTQFGISAFVSQPRSICC